MPKLDNATARVVNKAEGQAFVLVDEDQYRLKLTGVKISPKQDVNGNTYWIWSFDVVSGQTTGDQFKGKHLRTNTGFTEDQAWYPKMIFDAYGVKPNVDTDTLLGKELYAIVGQSEVQKGPRKGQLRNDITSFMSLDSMSEDDADEFDEDQKDAAGTGSADEDDDPDF